ncbi:MAG: hypothetical protein B6244_00640 [Candidatus Cloacimonetes bacterium 4572_55]|nr:MAG: hypothetical protein B6244_00640 [Candidatus Cloacimonetes bacterium 4572_55]
MNVQMMQDRIVLLADADADRRALMKNELKDLPALTLFARDGEEALRKAKTYPIRLAVLSQDLLQTRGARLGKLIKKQRDCEIILYGDGRNPIEPEDLVGNQIDDYLPILNDPAELRLIIFRHLRRMHLAAQFHIIGKSPKMREPIDQAIQIAATDSTLLLTGESGTGKELIARLVHQAGRRANKPFVAVNCGALPETLLESELFGHEKGSFTGASSRRIGHFESADQGTIFLDEIGEIAPTTQVKLLRVLEEREFMRVGGGHVIKVDARVIAATNRDLQVAMNQGSFRPDLFYRLKVISIALPPLRRRREDIPLLIDHFSEEMKQEYHIDFAGFSPQTMEILYQYDWPGNIRELRNFVESMAALYPHKEIHPSDLPEEFTTNRKQGEFLPVHSGRSHGEIEREILYKSLISLGDEMRSVREIVEKMWDFIRQSTYEEAEENLLSGNTIEEMELKMIRAALIEKNGNRRSAAFSLGISERTLYRKMSKYNIR